MSPSGLCLLGLSLVSNHFISFFSFEAFFISQQAQDETELPSHQNQSQDLVDELVSSYQHPHV
jgi:hypothetical protein